MSYSPEQVEQANLDCRHLTSRTGTIINPDYGGNSACVNEEDTQSVKTAGIGNIPMIAWYLIGAGVLYYIGKKQKWF